MTDEARENTQLNQGGQKTMITIDAYINYIKN